VVNAASALIGEGGLRTDAWEPEPESEEALAASGGDGEATAVELELPPCCSTAPLAACRLASEAEGVSALLLPLPLPL